MSKIIVGRQFCGPPNSGNGGYVCGVLAKGIEGPATAVLRAPIPLDSPLALDAERGGFVLTGHEGQLIGKAGPAGDAELPRPPPPPALEAARAAGARYQGLTQRIHPICFTCGPEREDGDGLKVFTGQLEGAERGVVAGVWTPHENFTDEESLTRSEVIWGALDCPGYFAWVEREGRHGALLGTMTGEVIRRPKAGEDCIVLAWPLVRDGRKETAGVALFSAGGELLARGLQVWIVMGPRPPQPAETIATA